MNAKWLLFPLPGLSWLPAAFVPRHAGRAAPPASARTLRRRELCAIERPAGRRLTCMAGCLWITVDGEPRDIVLEAGESFEASSDERVLVYALEDSRWLATGGGAR